tara:strand:+ start:121 stop:378 length:258 start_codon:yes stop_codon:yes gene_type:complete
MIKEIKYLFYLIVLLFFIYLIANYYFSDYYEKKSYRNISNFLDNLNSKKVDVPLIENDTKNIIEYKTNLEEIINKKERQFWELIE